MDVTTANEHIYQLIRKCENALTLKADEYATQDRLHNFKLAAKLQGLTPKQALGGMLSKHTISVYDLIWDRQGENKPLALWEEKLVDHINYLLLLYLVVAEEARETDDQA